MAVLVKNYAYSETVPATSYSSDLYTVPAGKQAKILAVDTVLSTTPTYKIDGIQFTQNNPTVVAGALLEAGTIVNLYNATAGALAEKFFLSVLEEDI